MPALVTKPATDLISGYHLALLRPRTDELAGGYLLRALQSKGLAYQFHIEAKGVTRYGLSHAGIKSVWFPLPPLPEQTAIVRYLDHADERIRRYISGKQKLIRLLEEEKQAIIHRAVTRGLDPNVRLKPSSVEWLGDVPVHWEVRWVKQASRILRGKFTHRPRNDPSLYDGPYPFIQTGDVAHAKKTITGYSQTLNKQGLAVSMMFPKGTLVMTIAANIGDVAILDFEACFPDSVVGFVPHQNVDRDYLYYLFRAMKAELLREAPVNTQGNLNVDRIGSRQIALPPLPEQIAIVAYLDKATSDIDTAISRTRCQIELLQEYRTRLIADVVTGKIDVREAAAGLPDEADELGAADADALCDELDALANEPGSGPLDTRANGSTDVPKMTPRCAMIVELMALYLRGLLDPFVTLLEVQKLMYFAQIAGEPLKLKFEKGPYGPYADNLRHVLKAMEGHLVSGYVDGENAPDKELNLVPGAREDARAFLANHPETQARFERVADCIEGFESSFGLELLSTVHWVVYKEEARTFDDVVDRTYAWDERKKQFSRRQLKIAVEMLSQKGWIENLSPSDTNETKQPIDTEPKSQESTICH